MTARRIGDGLIPRRCGAPWWGRYRCRVSSAGQGIDPWSLRASDADREKYLDVLRDAYAEGRLTAEEYDERIEATYKARTYRELVPVLESLPVKPGAVPGPPPLLVQGGRTAIPGHPLQVNGSRGAVAPPER